MYVVQPRRTNLAADGQSLQHCSPPLRASQASSRYVSASRTRKRKEKEKEKEVEKATRCQPTGGVCMPPYIYLVLAAAAAPPPGRARCFKIHHRDSARLRRRPLCEHTATPRPPPCGADGRPRSAC